MTGRKRAGLTVLLGTGLLILALGCALTGNSAQSCAGPSLDAEPERVASGGGFRLYGEGFFVGCNDTGQGRRMPPERDVRLEFRQDDKTWKLGTADADRSYAFEVPLRVPADARAGRAVVIDEGRSSGTIEVPFWVLGEEASAISGDRHSLVTSRFY